MSDDPIIQEIHRHREELYRECGEDPQVLLRFLQEKQCASGRQVLPPPPGPPAEPQRLRWARR